MSEIRGYIPSESSFAFTTYKEPPVSAAKRATRSSNSSSKTESSSEGRAPITGGSRASRYERNISELNKTVGSAGGISWFMPLVVRAGGGGGDASISTRKVDESVIVFIEDLLDLGDSFPQICLGGVLRWVVK